MILILYKTGDSVAFRDYTVFIYTGSFHLRYNLSVS